MGLNQSLETVETLTKAFKSSIKQKARKLVGDRGSDPLIKRLPSLTTMGNYITHRLLSSSFLGLPCRILNMNHKKELLRSLWVETLESEPIIQRAGPPGPSEPRVSGVGDASACL